jgi:hypothetical protein
MKSFARTALSLLLLLSASLNSNAMDHHIEQPETHHTSSEEVDEQDEEKKSSPRLTQREIGGFLFGSGVGLFFKRHPIIAALSLASGAIALTKHECNGLESIEHGFSAIRNARSMDEVVPGAVDMALGCGSFCWSIISNGVCIVHKQINQNN